MKVVLEEANSWPVDPADRLGDVAGGLRVVIGPLEPTKDLWGPWKMRALGLGVPKGGKSEIVKEVQESSTLGWAIDSIDSLVMDDSGKVVEARLTVLYFMLEWCAYVIVRGRAEQLAAERDGAVRLLMSARPDWSRPEVASIAQLYD